MQNNCLLNISCTCANWFIVAQIFLRFNSLSSTTRVKLNCYFKWVKKYYTESRYWKELCMKMGIDMKQCMQINMVINSKCSVRGWKILQRNEHNSVFSWKAITKCFQDLKKDHAHNHNNLYFVLFLIYIQKYCLSWTRHYITKS